MSNALSDTTPKPKKAGAIIWDPWLGVLFTIFLFFIAQIAAVLIVSAYPVLRGWSEERTGDWLQYALSAQFSAILLAGLISLGGLHLFLRRYKSNFKAIGLRRPRWSDFGYGIAGFPIYFVLYTVTVVAASALIPALNVDQKQELGFDQTVVIGGAAMALTFVSLVVIPPIVEEIMVRGMLYTSFKKAVPIVPAALLTSGLFAAAHLSASAEGPLYIAAVDTFVLSLVLIYVRELTGALWACIVLHALKNGVAFAILYVIR